MSSGSNEYWKNKLNQLSDTRFEELCLCLVKAQGYRNPDWREGAADDGRDIEAELDMEIPGSTTQRITQKWFFECKRYSEGIPQEKVETKINWADAEKANFLMIFSNSHLTDSAKRYIAKRQTQVFPQILDMTSTNFQDYLFRSPDISNIMEEFFPGEEVPPMYKGKIQSILEPLPNAPVQGGLELVIKNIKEDLTKLTDQQIVDLISEKVEQSKNIDDGIKALIFQLLSSFAYAVESEDKAIKLIDKAIEITPKSEKAILTKGYLLEKMGKIKPSNKCYEEILGKLNSKNKLAINNLAHNYKRLGNFDKAMELIEKALEIDPNFIIAINNKANILMSSGQDKEAIEYLDQQIKKYESKHLIKSQVNNLIEIIDLKKALELNEQLIKKYPEDKELLNTRGAIYEHNGQYQKPEKYYNLALQEFKKTIDKDFPMGMSNIIITLLNLKEFQEATKILNDASTKFPHDPFILNEKGRYYLNNNPKEALKYFNRAISIQSEVKFIRNKAQTLINLKKYPDAYKVIQNLILERPKDSKSWEIKAEVEKRQHKPAIAKISLKKANQYQRQPISLLEKN